MKIVIVTTQSPTQSTFVGRILPLATRLAQRSLPERSSGLTQQFSHDIHLLGHEAPNDAIPKALTFHAVGQNPFTSNKGTKKRLHGLSLIFRLLKNTFTTLKVLNRLEPQAIIIVKPLPQNVAAVSLYYRWLSLISQSPLPPVILDIDDYELTANQLTSLIQRAAVHWAEQEAHHLAHHVTVATPFLQEYSRQLAPHLSRTFIPTSAVIPDNIKPSPNTDSPIVLYIGSLSFSSGHRVDLLPDIWKIVSEKFPTARLRIAGDGHDQDQIKQSFQQKSLDQSVTFTGRFTPDDLSNLLKDVSLIIDPIDASLTNRAKSSYRASLAAFTGLPYVSSNIGIRPLWFPEAFHDRFFAQPDDINDYAHKCIELLSSPLNLDQVHHLQTYALRYTWNNLTFAFQQVITS